MKGMKDKWTLDSLPNTICYKSVQKENNTIVQQRVVCIMINLFNFLFIFFHFSQMWPPTLLLQEIAFCALFTLLKHTVKLVTQYHFIYNVNMNEYILGILPLKDIRNMCFTKISQDH